ncbi:MAG: hypothetical protein GX787_10825, partial [Tissierellia bacterium]|nr:hypothetical protein [Tissierellia bacterium]
QYQEDAFVWGKSLSPNAGNALLNITNFTPNQETRNMIFIMVAKGNVQNTSTDILTGTSQNNSWFFGWGADQRLQFGRIGNSSTYASLDVGAGLNGKWHVFTGIATQTGQNGGSLSLRIDGEVLGTTGTFTEELRHNDGMSINWKDIEIAELLIYRNQKSTHELDAIETYLIDKYNPDPEITNMKIISLRPIPSTSVYLNDSFTLPQTVYANMSNGTIQSAGVTWSTSIETDTPGLKTATATAVMDPTKTVTLSVYVMSVSYLKALDPITINHGDNYPLPNRITAVMTNGDEEKVDVRWSSKTNVLDVGTHTLTATFVGDNSKTVNLTVHVQQIAVTGVSLHENSMLLPKDSEAMLYASVAPSNASNRSLVWTSSDPTVATVDNDGKVKGVGEGTANITVKTVDGGFTDVSQITVFVSAISIQLNKSSTQLRINDQEQLTVIPNPEDAEINNVEWSSSNASVAEVDQTGKITAKSAGGTIITATVNTPGGILTATCQVNVSQVTVVDYKIVNYTRTGFIVYTLSADINIVLSDGTVHEHGRISGRGFFMSSYTTSVSGTALAESTGETVSYSISVTIP